MSNSFKKIASISALLSIFVYGATLCSNHACNNEITRIFKITYTQMGFLYTSIFIGFIFTTIITGPIVDKRGKLPIILFGMIYAIIGLISFILTKDYHIALISMFLMGACGGCAETHATGFVSDIYEGNERIKWLNFTQSAFGLGAFFGPILVGLSLKITNSYISIYYLISFIAFITMILLIISICKKEEKPLKKPNEKIPWKIIFKDKYIYFVIFALILYCGYEISFSGWMAKYYEDILHLSKGLAASSVSYLWLGIAIGSGLYGLISKKISAINIMIISIISVLLGFIIFFIKIPYISMFGVFFIGLFLGPQFPTILSFANNRHKKYSGVVNSILFTGANIGAIIFPTLMGYIIDISSIYYIFGLIIFICICNLILFSLYKKKADN